MVRDNFTCRYCGARATEVDHVSPESRGGPTVAWNLVAACGPCNRSKGAHTPAEWRAAQFLAQTPPMRQPLHGRRIGRRARRGRLLS
jgi:5-methylcytosine-specific restriction endonuclease McrA